MRLGEEVLGGEVLVGDLLRRCNDWWIPPAQGLRTQLAARRAQVEELEAEVDALQDALQDVKASFAGGWGARGWGAGLRSSKAPASLRVRLVGCCKAEAPASAPITALSGSACFARRGTHAPKPTARIPRLTHCTALRLAGGLGLALPASAKASSRPASFASAQPSLRSHARKQQQQQQKGKLLGRLNTLLFGSGQQQPEQPKEQQQQPEQPQEQQQQPEQPQEQLPQPEQQQGPPQASSVLRAPDGSSIYSFLTEPSSSSSSHRRPSPSSGGSSGNRRAGSSDSDCGSSSS